MARNKHRRPAVMADINITNLVDVTMVLLIIFIIVAPMLEQGLEIKLPQATGPNVVRKDAVQVSVTENNEIMVDNDLVDLNNLPVKIVGIMGDELTTRPVNIRGDKNVPWGDLALVLSTIRNAGITNINFVVQAPN